MADLIDENTPMDYRWLDFDGEVLYSNERRFHEAIRPRIESGVSMHMRAIPNYQFHQVLFVASHRSFTNADAMAMCRRLAGLTD